MRYLWIAWKWIAMMFRRFYSLLFLRSDNTLGEGKCVSIQFYSVTWQQKDCFLYLRFERARKTTKTMIAYFKIAIIFSSVLCFIIVDGREEKKCCTRDSECATYEKCSNQKCRDACIKHPCAENAICKVRLTVPFYNCDRIWWTSFPCCVILSM